MFSRRRSLFSRHNICFTPSLTSPGVFCTIMPCENAYLYLHINYLIMSRKRTPFPDAAADYPPAVWQAAWIWTADPTDGKHDYVCFRRTFDLASVPKQALLRMAAQQNATLWVNGKLIAHGPPISDPRFQRYETL